MSSRSFVPTMAVEPSLPARERPADFALGIGLTNECNLACAFCYRDASRVDRLSLAQVRAVLGRLPVRSVNLGTGENGMHPEFGAMLAYLRVQPLKLTITSNGHSIEILDDAEVTAFKDVEFSLDYPRARSRTASVGRATGTSCTSRRRAAAVSACRSRSSP